MHFSLFSCIVALITLVCVRVVDAAELEISSSLFSGVSYFDYNQELYLEPNSGIIFPDFEVNGVLPLIGGELRADYKPFYLYIQGQKTIKGEDDFELSLPVSLVNQRFDANFDVGAEFDRSEISIGAGYYLLENFGVYAGYRYANVDIANNLTLTSINGSLSPLPIEVDFDVDFSYHGPFAGITYVLPIERLNGNLSFTSAFTYYDAHIKQEFRPSANNSFQTETPDGADGRDEADGNAVGYSFQIEWRGDLTNNFSYKLRADFSKADFDVDQRAADFSETEYRFRAVLEYAFDTGAIFGFDR
jgi:hypothetical protein